MTPDFLTMILRAVVQRVALLIAGALAVLVLALALTHTPAPKPAPMRMMDQPRCFPPGTILPRGGFPGCPDDLPEMRAA